MLRRLLEIVSEHGAIGCLIRPIMRQISRWRRTLRCLALAVLGLLLAPFVAVQIQEWMFRYRAERVLADVRSLMIRKAPASEVEVVFRRWNPDRLTGCCAIDEVLGHPVQDSSPDYDASAWAHFWRCLFVAYGGRDASLHVRAAFKAGAVTQMGYIVRAYTSGPVVDNLGSIGMLNAEVSLSRDLPVEYLWEGLSIHPKYLVGDRDLSGGGDTPFGEAGADFAYDADPADIARLARIDLSCFTRLSQCRTIADFMPAVAAQYASEQPQFARMRKEHTCSPAVIESFARVAQYAGVADVVELTGIGAAPDPGVNGYRADLRMIQNLIPYSDWKEGKTKSVVILDVFGGEAGEKLGTSTAIGSRAGDRFIILIPQEWQNPRELNTDICGLVPLTPTNLELVRNTVLSSFPRSNGPLWNRPSM